MTTPVYEPPRGSKSYLTYVVACAVGIAWVVWWYVGDLVHSVRDRVVTVPVLVEPTAQVPQPPAGATIQATELAMRVRTSDVPAGALGCIRVGDAVEAVAVAALIAAVAAVALQISKGGLFDRRTTRLLDWVVGLTVVAGLLPDFVRQMGWNWVVSALGWDGRLPTPLVEPQYVPVYLGVLLVTCFRFALTASQRMVRDQAGLV